MKTIHKSAKLANVCYDIRGPVLDKARQMEEEGHKIIKLNIGNLAVFGFDAPEEIQQDMIRNLPSAAAYSDSKGIFAARKAVMQYSQEQGVDGVTLDDIYLGNGASELIVMATNALLNDGDEMLLPAPDYPLWTAAVSLSGGTPVHYMCDESNGWMPDIADIRSKITPNTKGIGLEKVGVQLDKVGAIAVDEWSKTTAENIWAVGDVTDRINLTPVAIMEGHCFADTVFGNKPRKPDHRGVPSAVFCQPEMANVGLTEEEAKRTLGELRIFTAAFRPMKYTLSGRQQRTFMKLIVEAGTDRVVGAHMVGDDAAELIQGLAVAIKAGATKAHFDATVGIHPTAGEEFVTMRTARADTTPTRAAAE